MTSDIQPYPNLSDDEIRDLNLLVEMIIPESDEYGLPGAGDEQIFQDILAATEPYRSTISVALKALNTIVLKTGQSGFVDLPIAQQEQAIVAFREQRASDCELLEALTVQCYYRDERVKRSLDMDIRPPFPGGFELEQGDWSLLDHVKTSTPFFRDAS